MAPRLPQIRPKYRRHGRHEQSRDRGAASLDPRFPDFPTIAEGGLPGYDLTYWLAMFAPAGLPAEIQQKLNGALNARMRS
jgi:tripartite-type tricarboxylate transporter receptor subunit TctC